MEGSARWPRPRRSPLRRPWPRRWLGWGYLVVVVAACLVRIDDGGWPWFVFGLGTAAAMVAGSAGCARRDRHAWWLLAGAQAVFTFADTAFIAQFNPPAELIELLYLPAYLLACTGLLLLIGPTRGRADVLDVRALAAGLVLVVILVTVRWPAVHSTYRPLLMLIPLADLLVGVLAIRLFRLRPALASALLAVGGLAAMGAGLAYALVGLQAADWWIKALWACFVAAWGLAGLLAAELGQAGPAAVAEGPASPVLFRLVVLLAPATLIAQSLAEGDGRDVVLALCCGLSALFVVFRLGDSIRYSGDVTRDAVTGVGSFMQLRNELATAMARLPAGQVMTLFLVDIHGFHAINDLVGPLGGNRILAHVGGRLSRQLGSACTVARTSADRFGVARRFRWDQLNSDVFAARLHDIVAQPITRSGKRLYLTCCVGYATSELAATGDDLLCNADLALHAAKEIGAGHSAAFTADMLAETAERARLRSDLGKAISAGQLFLEYQQIVDLRGGAIIGFEALVRWQHPVFGRIGPGKFVRLAEADGSIGDLGLWVLDRAVADAVLLNAAAGRPVSIQVNASARQIGQGEFVAAVESALRHSGLPSGAIVIEITESAVAAKGEAAAGELRRLKTAGVRLALDDFGTGYSSLSRLRTLPIDIVKIDKAFITSLRPGPRLVFVEGILRIAESLRLQVVAEGIEAPDVRDLLAQIGCELGQGYLFSRPMPIGTAIDQVRDAPTRLLKVVAPIRSPLH